MSEIKEEIIDEGEVVEVEIPEEKPSGKIADLAPVDEEAEQAIEDVSETSEVKSEEELEDYSEKVKKQQQKMKI